MQILDADELREQIELEYPQLSPTIIPWRSSYAVQVSHQSYEYSPYYGQEYAEFKRDVENRGFALAVEDNGLLILTTEKTVLVTTPGQWSLFLMLSGKTNKPKRSKGGRPPKNTHVA